MHKELYVSSTPHETRLAVAENGEIAEIYIERETEYSLAGSIYKGRVTRVLPGMQSAFVDIGLERDAFLYVSDFFEDSEEYDRVVSDAESAVARLSNEGVAAAGAPGDVAAVPAAEAAAPAHNHHDDRGGEFRRGRRGRGRGRRGGNQIPGEKFARPEDLAASEPAPFVEPETAPAETAAIDSPPIVDTPAAPAAPPTAAPVAFVLPGESLAKYRRAVPPSPAPPAPGPSPAAFEPPPALAAPPLPAPTPTAAPAVVTASAFVLPGESLARYRRTETPALAEADRPTEEMAEQVRHHFEEERSQPDSELSATENVRSAPVLPPAPETADTADDIDPDGPYEDIGDGPIPDELSFDDGALDDGGLADGILSEPLGDDADASAEVRADGAARLQAPAPAGETSGENRRRGRRRRGRGRGNDRDRDRPAPAHTRGDDAASAPRPQGKNESSRQIADLLREGQEILVQISKEPLGKKGARITSHLALPGRFLVYMPTVHHIGVSRRIATDEERVRLKRILLEHTKDLPGGFIARTAGEGASEEDIIADIRLLSSQWSELRQQFEQVRSPALLHHDLNLVERTLRDQLSDDFIHIWVDTDDQFQRVSKFVSYFMPQLAGRVRLYSRDEPMFEHFGVQDEINKSLKSKVWLKSGGYIVLNQTEALVAIDINTGKYVGRSNRLEDTIVKTNVEAIQEIVRQIRLRDLGGIIVIDFIDMDERKNRQKVMQALEEAMRADRAPSKVLSFNDFGLVALTRKRVKQSLERTLGSPCPYCTGVGLVKSPVTVCNEIYSEIRKLAPTIERDDLVLRVNPEVAKVLKQNSAQRIREIEEATRKVLAVRPDPLVHQEQFEIY